MKHEYEAAAEMLRVLLQEPVEDFEDCYFLVGDHAKEEGHFQLALQYYEKLSQHSKVSGSAACYRLVSGGHHSFPHGSFD